MTAFNIWPQGAPQRVDNFIPTSMAGKIGPLMQLDKKGTPVNAPAYNWLCETLEALGDIEVLILDPKSMLYGLEENNNDHNTAWVKCLQSIAQKFGITIIFCHHESKARAGSQDAASSRGGAALTDGCRWVANIRGMSEKVAEKFALTDHQDYVEFVVTKSNYAPRLPNPVYFRRGKHGELSFIDLVAERLQAIARMLVEMLAGLPEPLTMNQLIYRPEGRDGRDKLKEQVESFGRKDLGDAVGFALEAKWLGTLTRKEPGRGNPKSLLVVLGSNRE